ncbi:MAG: permease [Chthonomonadales bacterium]|nr:permease [Chthonomonadales bacterium]
MQQAEAKAASRAVLRLPEFRYLLYANGLSTLGGRALAVVIGYQIYSLTRKPIYLGWLGFVEAMPAILMALFGGHLADRADRRRIVLTTQSVSILCMLGFALLSAHPQPSTPLRFAGHPQWSTLYGFYVITFLAGIARGFADPASTAFEAQVIPREVYVYASSWSSSVWQGCAIVGPALGGITYSLIGAQNTYLCIAGLYILSLFSTSRIAPKPIPVPEEGESIWQSIAVGVRYVLHNQVIVGSMALDLFAVLFGGVIALLPVFAKDILHVSTIKLGFMTAAPSVGALLVTLWSTHRPPIRHAGRNMLVSVAGFGVAIIAFALSKNFYFSLFTLFLTGMFDGVSVVVRRSVLRLLSPENMRGRIASVNWIFIGASNEIGAFESGIAASLLGTVRSVWIGGILTLLVVGVTAGIAPKLRRLNLENPEEP